VRVAHPPAPVRLGGMLPKNIPSREHGSGATHGFFTEGLKR
jgi:hypothetical protein